MSPRQGGQARHRSGNSSSPTSPQSSASVIFINDGHSESENEDTYVSHATDISSSSKTVGLKKVPKKRDVPPDEIAKHCVWHSSSSKNLSVVWQFFMKCMHKDFTKYVLCNLCKLKGSFHWICMNETNDGSTKPLLNHLKSVHSDSEAIPAIEKKYLQFLYNSR